MFSLSSQQTGQKMAAALREHGAAPGAQMMLDWERAAAEEATRRGVYVSWRSNRDANDCTRVGNHSMCFCGHVYGSHFHAKKTARNLMKSHCKEEGCKCKRYQFIPIRPEECGMWWLPRRPDFNIHKWAPKCRCKHTHKQHTAGVTARCRAKGCGCGYFESDFACVVCDRKWEDHETVFETEEERVADGRPVGESYQPLVEVPEIQDLVYNHPNKLKAGKPRPKLKNKAGAHGAFRVEELAGDDSGGRGGAGYDAPRIEDGRPDAYDEYGGVGHAAAAAPRAAPRARGDRRRSGGGGGGGGGVGRGQRARVPAEPRTVPFDEVPVGGGSGPMVEGRQLRVADEYARAAPADAPRVRRAAGAMCRADASCRCRRCMASMAVVEDLGASPAAGSDVRDSYGADAAYGRRASGGGGGGGGGGYARNSWSPPGGRGDTLGVLAGGDPSSEYAPARVPRGAPRGMR